MAGNERVKKYLEAGSVLGQVTRARAEEIVKELVSAGDIQRGQAQEWVDNLVERSRKTSEQVLDLVRHEVASQLSKIDSSAVEGIANQVADILKRSAEAGRSATSGATTRATKTAKKTAKAARKATERVTPSGRKKKGPAKKSAAKKAPAKKSAAKKAPAKKSAAKKAPAKKAPAKKAPAKKAGTGRSSS
jgi:DNA-binding protein HU-beta